MKLKIKITGVNVHDLLFKGFLIQMAFDAMVMKFHAIKETIDGEMVFDRKIAADQQVLVILLDDRERQIEYFKRLLESRDYNTDKEQLKYFGDLMKKTGSRIQITKIEYEPYDEEVPELLVTMPFYNCRLIDTVCDKKQYQFRK